MGLFDKLFGKKKAEKPYPKSEKSNMVVDVPGEDDTMNWAIEKANWTLGYFKESILNPKEHQNYFSIKAKLIDGDYVEHMWLINPSFDEDGNLFGELNNVPNNLNNVELGQKIGVANDMISDWMILEHGNRLIGGYTMRAIRDAMPENEQKAFDQQTGMYIDYGIDYFEPNQATPEGAIVALEEAYEEKNIDKAIQYKDFHTEARMMLESRNIPKDEAILNRTAEALMLSFKKHMIENGFPNFDNMTRAFRREKLEDDLYIISEISHHTINNTWGIDQHYVAQKNGKWYVAGLKS